MDFVWSSNHYYQYLAQYLRPLSWLHYHQHALLISGDQRATCHANLETRARAVPGPGHGGKMRRVRRSEGWRLNALLMIITPYQQFVPAWCLAWRGGGGRRKWSSSGCVDISRVSWLSRTLQQCQHSAIAVPSLTPAKQPDNTFISLAAGGAARGRVVCSTQCPLPRPPPRSGALERRKSSLHYDRVKVEYWCHRSPPPPEQSLALSSAPLFGEPE